MQKLKANLRSRQPQNMRCGFQRLAKWAHWAASEHGLFAGVLSQYLMTPWMLSGCLWRPSILLPNHLIDDPHGTDPCHLLGRNPGVHRLRQKGDHADDLDRPDHHHRHFPLVRLALARLSLGLCATVKILKSATHCPSPFHDARLKCVSLHAANFSPLCYCFCLAVMRDVSIRSLISVLLF